MKLPWMLPIVLFPIITGCIKPADDVAAPLDTRTYLVPVYDRGGSNESLTVKLYLSKEDYVDDKNVVKTFIIPRDVDSLEVELDKNVTYYYDVSSDNNTMSNWAYWPHINISFNTDPKIRHYAISNYINNYKAILIPDEKQSKWIAVGSFVKLGNTWDTMSVEGRTKSIVFKRNQSAFFTDGSYTREFRFGVSGNNIAKNAFSVKLYDTENLDFIEYRYEKAYMTFNGPASNEYKALNPYSSNSNIILPVTDTLYLTSDAFKHTFIMVREK